MQNADIRPQTQAPDPFSATTPFLYQLSGSVHDLPSSSLQIPYYRFPMSVDLNLPNAATLGLWGQ